MSELDLLIRTGPNIEAKIPERTEEDNRAIQKIRDTWRDWRTWFESNHRDRIRENYRRYHATIPQYESIEDQWRGIDGHPIRLALEYAVVETYKTRLIKSMFGNPDFLKLLPTKTSTIEKANKMTKAVLYSLRQDEFEDKSCDMIDMAMRNGSVPWVVSQKQAGEKKTAPAITRPIINAFGIQLGQQTVRPAFDYIDWWENRPTFEPYDIEFVAFNQTIGSYEKSPWYIIRQIVHRAELVQIFPQFKDLINSGLIDWDGQDDFLDERKTEIGQSSESFLDTGRTGKIEVHYWMEPEGMAVVFSDQVIIKIPNKSAARKKEVFTGMLNILPVAGDPYGKDLIQLESQFADLWNELINIAVDSAKQAGNLVTKVKKNAGVEYDTIFWGPGNQWLMDDLDAVQVEQYNFNPAAILQLLPVISEKDQQVTGATSAVMGTPTGAKHAVDVQRAAVESNMKYWLMLRNIQREQKKIVRAIIKHIQEYVMPTVSPQNPLMFMITGENGDMSPMQIDDPNELDGDFDVKISLEPEDIDRNVLRAQFISAINIIMRNPGLNGQVNPVELLKVLFKMFPELKEMELIAQDPAKQLQVLMEKLEPQQLMNVLGYIQELIKFKAEHPNQGQPQVKGGGRIAVPSHGRNLGKTGMNIPGAGPSGVNAPGGAGSGRIF